MGSSTLHTTQAQNVGRDVYIYIYIYRKQESATVLSSKSLTFTLNFMKHIVVS